MNRKNWLVRLMVGFVKLTGMIPALLFLKPRVIRTAAKKRLPAPCILVSNHKSLMDFVLYLMVFPFRTVRFLMAEVLFNKGKLFGWFLGAIGGIRVNRDSKEFGFVADSVEVLEKGGTVGIFPEGRLPIGGKPWPFTVSTAFIATRVPEVPIVPVYTDGNYGLFKRVTVVVGEPIYLTQYQQAGLSEQAQLEHLTSILAQAVYALKEQTEKYEKSKTV